MWYLKRRVFPREYSQESIPERSSWPWLDRITIIFGEITSPQARSRARVSWDLSREYSWDIILKGYIASGISCEIRRESCNLIEKSSQTRPLVKSIIVFALKIISCGRYRLEREISSLEVGLSQARSLFVLPQTRALLGGGTSSRDAVSNQARSLEIYQSRQISI